MAVLKRTLVVQAILVVTIGSVASVRAQGCHLRELDLCAATAAGVKGVPVTDEEVTKYCGLANDAFQCFNDYKEKCMTPIQKELVAYVLGDGHKAKADKFCTKGDELRTNYLKQAPCLAKAHADSRKCLVDGQAALEVIEEVPFDNKVTTACCAVARFKKCSFDIVEATCGAEAVGYANTMIHLMSSNLIDVACQGFEQNPVCGTLLPPPGTPPKNNGKSLVSKLISTYMKS